MKELPGAMLQVSGVAIRVADSLLSLLDDFAPSITLREIADELRELRARLIDSDFLEEQTVLQARFDATQRARSVLAAHGEAAQVPRIAAELDERLRMLREILDPEPTSPDDFGGTVGFRGLTIDEGPFRPVGEHPGTLGILGETVRAVARRALGSREARDKMIARRVKIRERQRVLAEMREWAASAARPEASGSQVAADVAEFARRHFEVAAFAEQALRRERGSSSQSAPPGGEEETPKENAPAARGGSRTRRIPID